jgi:hypothetical protein
MKTKERARSTVWTCRATVEAGRWAQHGAEPVDIPATMALDRGVWYRVRQGRRGLLVEEEKGQPHLYVKVGPGVEATERRRRAVSRPLSSD